LYKEGYATWPPSSRLGLFFEIWRWSTEKNKWQPKHREISKGNNNK